MRRLWPAFGALSLVAQGGIVWAFPSAPGAWPRAAAMVGLALTLVATWRMARRPPELGLGRALRVLLFAVIGWWVTICLQPFNVAALAEWGAAAFGVLTVLIASSRGVAASRLEVAATNVCLILIGIEAALQVAARVRPSPLTAQFGSDAGVYVESIRPAPHQSRPGFMAYNSWGEYDVEPAKKKPGECLVVTIGDSFSPGIVPHALHFTTVAERELPGCQIYNMGIARTGPREYKYLLVKEALGLSPDLIVVNLFVGNDLSDDYGCNPSPLRQWLDRENLLTYVVPRRLWAWARERGRSGGERPVGVPQMDSGPNEMPWLLDPSREQPSFSEPSFLEIETARMRAICGPDAAKLEPDFFRALDELVRAAGRTPLAFMLIPDELQVEDALWRQVSAGAPQPLERDRAQRVVGAWLRARGLPVLDLLPALRAAPAWTDGRKHLYHLRDTHFNARGNEVAGTSLAPFLKSLLKR